MIRQKVQIIINLVPDGTSSTFQLDMASTLGFHVPDLFSGSASERWPFVLSNPQAIPDSVDVDSVLQGGIPITGVTGTVGHRSITLTFPSAPNTSAGLQVSLSVNFNG